MNEKYLKLKIESVVNKILYEKKKKSITLFALIILKNDDIKIHRH